MAIIDKYLSLLKSRKGSDLHISPGNPPLCRIAGELTPLEPTALTAEQTIQMLTETLLPEQRAELDKTHDLDYAYEVQTLEARFRVNLFIGRLGMGGVFRLIPTQIKTIKELGLPESLQ